jgi:hypothetical protein
MPSVDFPAAAAYMAPRCFWLTGGISAHPLLVSQSEV